MHIEVSVNDRIRTETMKTSRHVRICLLATLIATSMAPWASANTSTSPTAMQESEMAQGYTDKTSLRKEGRAISQAGQLRVSDQGDHQSVGTTYYVDSAQGDDRNDGKSPSRPWKSFAEPNRTAFKPGDALLLKAGSMWKAQGTATAKEAYTFTEWSGNQSKEAQGVGGSMPTSLLSLKGSGSSDQPIILSSYGEGAAPKLMGMGTVNDVVQLTNQEHWDISNLDISNMKDGFDAQHFTAQSGNGQAPGTENPDTGDLRGIHIQAQDAGTLSGYKLHDLFIHDVAGVTWSISKAGVDRSKRTGGIVFEGLKGGAQEASQLQDVEVYRNYIVDTAFGNIVFKQFSGMGTARYQDKKPGWGDRAVAKADVRGNIQEDPDWSPHSGVIIRDNYLSNRNTQYGWDAIYLTSVRDSTIQGNLIDGAGVSGIELYWTDNIIVANNEVGELERRTGAADSNGIDADRGTSNVLIQNNFIHDSGEGFLLCGFSFSTAIVRYNLVRNVDRNYINPHGDSGVNLIYNNLFYNSQEPGSANTDRKIHYFASSGDSGKIYSDKNLHDVYNNLFLNTRDQTNGALFQDGFTGVSFSNNAYYGPGVSAAGSDPHPITENPLIKGDPSDDINNIEIASVNSPLIAAGQNVDCQQLVPGFKVTGADHKDHTSPSCDFLGKPLGGRPNIGPSSYLPASSRGVLTGLVNDQDGHPVSDAVISWGQDSTHTDKNGHYAVELPAGEYTLRASHMNYDSSAEEKITIESGTTRVVDLTLGPVQVSQGTLSGTITSENAGLRGASIIVTNKSGNIVGQGESGQAGTYNIDKIPAGKGYQVEVSKQGYEKTKQTGIDILPARTTYLDLSLKRNRSYEPVIDEDFNHEPLGTFHETSDGVLTSKLQDSIGSITIEPDADNPGNQYLKINKTSGSKGTLAVYNKVAQNLTGLVTIEARVKRTSTNPSPNQAAMYSYSAADWNTSDPAASTNPSATFGFSGSDIITHSTPNSSKTTQVSPYKVGQWYQIKSVVDLDSGTFSLYLDDMNRPILYKQPLRTAPASGALDYWSFYINGSNRGDWLIDYVRVGRGEPAHTNITSLASIKAITPEETLNLSTSEGGTTYEGTLQNPFLSRVTLQVSTSDPLATVSINGGSQGSEQEVNLIQSASNQDATIKTRIPVVVTAQDGTTQTFQVDLIRPNPSQTTYLKDLSLKNLPFSENFLYNRQGKDLPYQPTRILDKQENSVTVQWVRGWSGQTVTVNGKSMAADQEQISIPVGAGKTSITVGADSFTGESGVYTILVERQDDQTGSGQTGTNTGDGSTSGSHQDTSAGQKGENGTQSGSSHKSEGAGMRNLNSLSATGVNLLFPVCMAGLLIALGGILLTLRVLSPFTSRGSERRPSRK